MKKLIPIVLLLAGLQWTTNVNAQATPPDRPSCEPVDGGLIIPPHDGDITCGVVKHCDIDRMSIFQIPRNPNQDKYRVPIHMSLDLDNKVFAGTYRPIELLSFEGDVTLKDGTFEADVEILTVLAHQVDETVHLDFYVNSDYSDKDGQPLSYVGTQIVPVALNSSWTYFNPVINNHKNKVKIHTYNAAGELTVLNTPYLITGMSVDNVTLHVNNLANDCGNDAQPFDISLDLINFANAFAIEPGTQ